MKKIKAVLVVAMLSFTACHHAKTAAKTTPPAGGDMKPAGGDGAGTAAAPAGGDAKPAGGEEAPPAEPPK